MNCWLSPKIITTPSTAEEISKILALCRFLEAKFSIRGGGHLQLPGFTSNDGGVVINMSKFKDITVSEDRTTCVFGPGLQWLELYQALDPYGLAVTGGRIATVGVTGLLLGGGLSFQNNQHGFGATSVLDYEVCLNISTTGRSIIDTVILDCSSGFHNRACKRKGKCRFILGAQRRLLKLWCVQ